MSLNTKKYTARWFGVFAIANLMLYFFAHMEYLFMNDSSVVVFEYLSYYTERIADFVMPILITVLIYIALAFRGFKYSLLFGLAVFSSRVFFTIPFYYLTFVLNYGYDSIEAVFLALTASVAVVLFNLIWAWLSLLVAYIFVKKKRSFSEVLDEQPALLADTEQKDFLHGANYIIAITVLCRFIYALTAEIIDTVRFFIDHADDYTFLEILTPMLNYIIIFVLLILSYILSVFIKGKVIRERLTANEAEQA